MEVRPACARTHADEILLRWNAWGTQTLTLLLVISPEARSTARPPPRTEARDDTVGTTALNCDSSNPVRAGPLKTEHTGKAAVDTDVLCHMKRLLIVEQQALLTPDGRSLQGVGPGC